MRQGSALISLPGEVTGVVSAAISCPSGRVSVYRLRLQFHNSSIKNGAAPCPDPKHNKSHRPSHQHFTCAHSSQLWQRVGRLLFPTGCPAHRPSADSYVSCNQANHLLLPTVVTQALTLPSVCTPMGRVQEPERRMGCHRTGGGAHHLFHPRGALAS